MRSRMDRLTAIVGLVFTLTACSSHQPARIEQKSVTAMTPPSRAIAPLVLPASNELPRAYRVAAGDTLYSIAWRFGVDHRMLAQLNGISDPHKIYVGQVLAMRGTVALRTARAPDADEADNSRPAPKSPREAPRTPNANSPSVVAADIQRPPITKSDLWVWPTTGTAVRAVSATGSIGLEIKGQRAQPVKAAAAGQVVYSGNGLRGYGQLLIIKHDETFLSAYAHNDKLLVGEGQRVEAGQTIALMGDSEASEVMLHFEIRRNGKAVEPLQFLPQR
ncbi:MAG: peptidoglycan DD-metalloendopeptidase family protein [Gammaproteobacteria bacterium]|nr:peptidoglycan DD-metalloendopeptidase family protein [Gammaproteobacteria bacterium]